jgi:hypothetical protein
MSIYIFEQDAFEKIIEIEGEKYRKYKEKFEFGTCSFDAFLQEWKENCEPDPAVMNHKPEFCIDVESNGAIYGFGGWNRYFVLNSGEVVFSRLHGVEKVIEKAKEIGFRIW